MDYDKNLKYDIDLDTCPGETQGFIWFNLLVTSELMIFSVRAPSYFFTSAPSWKLVASVYLTLIAGGLIACLDSTFDLQGSNLGYILVYNVAAFIVVDFFKVGFRKAIGEESGDVIASDELIEPQKRTGAQKKVEKDMRYVVYQEAETDPADFGRVVELRNRAALNGFFDLGTSLNLNDGFVNQRACHKMSMVGAAGAQRYSGTGRTRRRKQYSLPL